MGGARVDDATSSSDRGAPISLSFLQDASDAARSPLDAFERRLAAAEPDPRDGRLKSWWSDGAARSIEDEIVGRSHDRIALRMVLPVVVPVLIFPAHTLLTNPDDEIALLALGVGLVAIAYVGVADLLERRFEQGFAIRSINTCIYSLMITGLVYGLVSIEHEYTTPHWIAFTMYFMLIGATGLSDEPWLPVVAAGASILGCIAIPIMLDLWAIEWSATAIRLRREFDPPTNGIRSALLLGAGAMAVAGARRGRMVRRLTLRDGLTGLLNRRAFEQFLETITARAQGRRLGMTVAMIDIDHFKRVNDAYGHAVGDAVLRRLARWLDRAFRSSDVVARYGGEEFVILFPDADERMLRARLEQVRLHLSESGLRLEELDGDEIQLTISAGVASMPQDGEDVAVVLRRADERLYLAKQTGRDQIVGREVE